MSLSIAKGEKSDDRGGAVCHCLVGFTELVLGEHLASRLLWGWRREQEGSKRRQQDKALSEDFEIQVYIMLKKQNER